MKAQNFLYLEHVMPDYFVPMYTFIGAVSIANYVCSLYSMHYVASHQLCYELLHVHVSTIVVIFINMLVSICMAGTVNIMIYCDFTCTNAAQALHCTSIGQQSNSLCDLVCHIAIQGFIKVMVHTSSVTNSSTALIFSFCDLVKHF